MPSPPPEATSAPAAASSAARPPISSREPEAAEPQGKPQGERIYFPHLDGLRFWAFFAVFLCHAGMARCPNTPMTPFLSGLEEWLNFGYIGVNFFFVLSGFLITYLLLAEHEKSGGIDVLSFYARRVLRIWPLYFVCVAVGFATASRFPYAGHLPPLRYFLSFTTNMTPPSSASGVAYDAGPMAVLWSIAVEEQFYLAWPLLMAAWLRSLGSVSSQESKRSQGFQGRSGRLPRPWIFFAGVCALSLAWRIGLRHDSQEQLRNTLCVIGDMALGGWASWHAFSDPRWPAWFEALPGRVIVGAYVILAAACLSFAAWRWSPWLLALSRPVLAAGFAFVILEQCYATNSFYKCGRSRWLSKLGTYTFGLYCLHLFTNNLVQKIFIVLRLDKHVWQLLLLQTPVMLAFAIAAAAASHHFLERPFLRLKRRFAHVKTT